MIDSGVLLWICDGCGQVISARSDQCSGCGKMRSVSHSEQAVRVALADHRFGMIPYVISAEKCVYCSSSLEHAESEEVDQIPDGRYAHTKCRKERWSKNE